MTAEERAMMARIRAVVALRPDQEYSCIGDVITVKGDGELPPEAEIAAKIREEEAVVAMKLLRSARNDALQATDAEVLRALEKGGSVSAEWRGYRQALRDLPARATPALNEDGDLVENSIPAPPPRN